jgi:hypothetical protein
VSVEKDVQMLVLYCEEGFAGIDERVGLVEMGSAWFAEESNYYKNISVFNVVRQCIFLWDIERNVQL